MSLTAFLGNKDVKDRFRQEFKMPRLAIKRELLAPPLSKRYTLVGTAFDYLMRFYLKRLNPNAMSSKWVAEYSIISPWSPLMKDVVIDGQTGEIFSHTETELTKKARQIIEHAKTEYSNYLSSGRMTDQLIESTLCLAQLDPIYRAGFVDENLGTVYEEDADDLRNLIAIVKPDLFKAAHLCLLNPTFGKASHLVGGADADLLIDDTIIEIKTTKKLQLQRRNFDQLVAYFVLHEISGIGSLTLKPEISRVAIYFSRHAYIHIIDLEDIIHTETFPNFVTWFIERAKQDQRVT